MGVNDPYDPYGLAPVPPPLGDRGDVPSTRRRRRDLFDDESSHHADLEDKAALVQEQAMGEPLQWRTKRAFCGKCAVR